MIVLPLLQPVLVGTLSSSLESSKIEELFYLLMEDGSYLLLEDGSKIILE